MDERLKMHGQYILKHRRPVICDDLLKWGTWFGNDHNRRIRVTYINGIKISTVFLALDHCWDEGPPVLFETMIFNMTDDDEYQTRCTTHRQALAMHKDAVKYAKDAI